jgi:OTU domain-containing protein 6
VEAWVYSATAPVLKMGEEFSEPGGAGGGTGPLRLSYHKHYYALGEHYNSIQQSCCDNC